jgi:predicted nucleic acid-binding Zn ribbon protein
MRIRRRLRLQLYKCELCGSRFGGVQHVLKHKRVAHVPTGAYKCYNCSCQFQTHKSLARHMTIRHPFHPLDESLMRCD